ncbi:MAG: helix-turn-helix domain-containing protein [Solirubrobacteraceae bacterium]
MSAYVTAEQLQASPSLLRTLSDGDRASKSRSHDVGPFPRHGVDLGALDGLIATIAESIADAVAERLEAQRGREAPEWLDSRDSAEYLGLHRDTLRKLAAERAIPAVQDGPGCKLFFLRSDLDEWRRAGGRAAHLAARIAA